MCVINIIIVHTHFIANLVDLSKEIMTGKGDIESEEKGFTGLKINVRVFFFSDTQVRVRKWFIRG